MATVSPPKLRFCTASPATTRYTAANPMVANAAGINRRNRRNQNRFNPNPPPAAASDSRNNNDVIKNPDNVKNVDTPKNPPLAHENPPWNNNTANTATPRNPSKPGKNRQLASLPVAVPLSPSARGSGSGTMSGASMLSSPMAKVPRPVIPTPAAPDLGDGAVGVGQSSRTWGPTPSKRRLAARRNGGPQRRAATTSIDVTSSAPVSSRPVIDLHSPGNFVDLVRYPVDRLDTAEGRAMVGALRQSLADTGLAQLPGFVKPEIIERMTHDALTLRADAHLEDVWGTPYLGLPDESFPPGHPRRHESRSLTWVIGYDQIPGDDPLRQLYEWPVLTEFMAEVLEIRPLHRFGDPLGALNMTVMEQDHTQGWHYDNTDFVVSLAIQSSTGGGEFECAARIRSDDDENYDEVASVLAEQAGPRVEVYPMVPGTLMIFHGRRSVHRVSAVEGDVPRIVALLSWDREPDTDSSELFKLVRYGRSEPLAAPVPRG